MAQAPCPDASPIAEFERSLDELEQLVQKLEHGEMSLDDSLQAFERGIALYRSCHGALEQAETRVKLLLDPADPASAVPFEPES
ncbi:MAG TPA: exodeoxyribonuclease VII small subunit [Xanthomonadales bacterium]|nr:exodeoxyribonuclease VII small subunit [Xanthomonadales bacterium]